MLAKKGVKRILALLMLMASPFAYSDPISLFQETLPPVVPTIRFHIIKELEPLSEKKPAAHKPKTHGFVGVASWYSQADAFINRETASGEIFDDRKMTCASWDHPFGTRLKVTNLENKKSVVCRVNDRGPNKRLARAIDLTISAFRRIAEPQRGLIRVSVTKLTD